MRKFVIKNRRKRKYTKKSEAAPSFSFSKTAYSMIPLLIMVIAFMSTILISSPFRNSLTNVTFTFTLPRFSLTNPIGFFLALAGDIAQISSVIWTITQLASGTIFHSIVLIVENLTYGISLLVNFLILCWDSIVTGGQFILQVTINGLGSVGQLLTFIFQEISAFIISTLIVTFKTLFAVRQWDIAINNYIDEQTLHFLFFIFSLIASVTITIVNFVIFILSALVKFIVSTTIFIATAINHFFLAIIHAIEIPFKILYAFGLFLKPYVDVFDKHVAISGNDFSGMFDSLNKMATLITPHK